MTLFAYSAIDENGNEVEGTIDAVNQDVAINAIQRRGLVIASIKKAKEEGETFLTQEIGFLQRVSTREVVILSRQIATLFEAQVSALKVFSLLAAEAENPLLRDTLTEVTDDLRGGSSISQALAKHPKVFSSFYVNLVRNGEESGKLNEVFLSLADYLDRMYGVLSKVRNALIYPIFVIITFIVVMILMLTMVIPRISGILEESGQGIPIYTRIVLGISNFFVHYGFLLAALAVIGIGFLVWYGRKPEGRRALSRFKIELPYIGSLYRKLYLSRMADNLYTMLTSGIPMIKAIETTADIVDNVVYEEILKDAASAVQGGSTLSKALADYDEVPGIMTQMIRIGEETGELGKILSTLARFYRREVNNAVDTLVDLIEPAMIVLLGAGVGVLLASVLIPIYNIATSI